MWRYVAGGGAMLLMLAAGWLLFSGRAQTEPVLPVAPPMTVKPAAQPVQDDAALPEASDRTREEKRFDRFDKDRDERITREEYLVARRKAFAKLDANGDGRLSFEEWAVKTTTKFAGADRDKSGAMDRAEFATTAVKRKPKAKCVCPTATPDDD